MVHMGREVLEWAGMGREGSETEVGGRGGGKGVCDKPNGQFGKMSDILRGQEDVSTAAL